MTMVQNKKKRLVFVTSNENKVRELSEHVSTTGFFVEQKNIRCPEIQADTLEEVVSFSLSALSQDIGEAVLLEDSGFFIDALEGFPGVYSSYVHKTLGNHGILRLLEGVENRTAVFKAVMGVIIGNKKWIVSGQCEGAVCSEEKGTGGFGYDPIFIPDGEEKTFAEMTTDEKNNFSHRARAAEELVKLLNIIEYGSDSSEDMQGCGV